MDSAAAILKLPLIGILRGFRPEQLPHIFCAVAAGGLRNIEITMNSPGATDQIRFALEMGGLHVGAGTVTTLELLEEALAAGAEFIVTPTFNREIVSECVRRKLPVFPGAFTVTEIFEAWELGATMVKVFPADSGGPAYLRALRGSFPHLKLVPTGGVDLQTASDFLRAGADGLGVGSPLFDKRRIENTDWTWLREQTSRFVELFQAA
jgi:2-dehydro-3-deoxyphosphogluconate aldolase / (4S)-4-hydroxy-2-oxoglutarate aldolase